MESTLRNDIRSFMTQGQFQQALTEATAFIEEAHRSQNVELQLTSYIQRLHVYIQQQAIEQATADLHVCEQLINEYPAHEKYAGVVYCASGMLNALTQHTAIAHEQLSLAISAAYEHQDWLTVSTAYASMSKLSHIQLEEAIALARTAVLFAHRIEHTASDVYVTRALLQLLSLSIKAARFQEVTRLFEQLQQLLSKQPYVREQLQAEALWLHYYVSTQQYALVIEKSPLLLEKIKHVNECDVYRDVLRFAITSYTALQLYDEAALYAQQYEALQTNRQQQPICTQLIEEAPSHFEGLCTFKTAAQRYVSDPAGYALLLFYIESAEPLAYEHMQQIFDKLHFFLAQTNMSMLLHNTFETHKMLYVVKEDFAHAAPAIQHAIAQTLLHVKEPINLLFGYTHNVEHEAFTFDECLTICHAYLYYNQWALVKNV